MVYNISPEEGVIFRSRVYNVYELQQVLMGFQGQDFTVRETRVNMRKVFNSSHRAMADIDVQFEPTSYVLFSAEAPWSEFIKSIEDSLIIRGTDKGDAKAGGTNIGTQDNIPSDEKKKWSEVLAAFLDALKANPRFRMYTFRDLNQKFHWA